jgi:hypothetical protein
MNKYKILNNNFENFEDLKGPLCHQCGFFMDAEDLYEPIFYDKKPFCSDECIQEFTAAMSAYNKLVLSSIFSFHSSFNSK